VYSKYSKEQFWGESETDFLCSTACQSRGKGRGRGRGREKKKKRKKKITEKKKKKKKNLSFFIHFSHGFFFITAPALQEPPAARQGGRLFTNIGKSLFKGKSRGSVHAGEEGAAGSSRK